MDFKIVGVLNMDVLIRYIIKLNYIIIIIFFLIFNKIYINIKMTIFTYKLNVQGRK